jgi:hypothetical protein
LRYPKRASSRSARDGESRCKENEMNGGRYYGVRVEGAKFGIGFGSALAILLIMVPEILIFSSRFEWSSPSSPPLSPS